MTPPPPDGSRDRRIEDPTNLYLIHPLGRRLLGPALRARVSANAVSVAGLFIGLGAAWGFGHWVDWRWSVIGLLLAAAWLVADGLDGMIARATGTASPLGRVLDGVCDHGVFILIYVAVALSIGTVDGWALAIIAGTAHAVQSSLYEGERARYHRRIKGAAPSTPLPVGHNPFVRLYDAVAFGMDRVTARFDAALDGPDGHRLRIAYADGAVPPMRLLALLTANMRVLALFGACVAGRPELFCWIEIAPMTLIAIAGIAWHRRVETRLLARAHPLQPPRELGAVFFSKDQIG
ncbi:CDP-alcohol phosphatidyltransferase family protein [uncultured Sphingomonas sp.]|uniref:CDP-alcohol phosphatidyltransferase family protein n=1 Tax=uncultured Sphingomonas sp. TaxID=158754 RepID=UPI0035CC99CC